MKYPNWNEYDDDKKWLAIEREIELVTHNGTTKNDLLNMMFFMHDQIRAVRVLEPMIKRLEQENERLKITLEATCDICGKHLHPLESHFGKLKGKLTTAHIDCWNKEIEKE